MTTSESMLSLDSGRNQEEKSRNLGQGRHAKKESKDKGRSTRNDLRTAEDLGFATDDPADMQMEDWLSLVKTKADQSQIEAL